MTKTVKSNGILSFGVAIVLVGVVLVLLNLGVLPPELRPVIISWQMLLIVIGVINLFKRSYVGGSVLIIVGSFFIIPKIIKSFPDFFGALNPDFVQNLWPLLLIVLGLVVIVHGFGHKRRRSWSHTKFSDEFSGKRENIGSSFDKNVIFSGGEYIVLDPEFNGGELNAIFGGIDLDLRKTSLPEGDTYLEVNAIFGGVAIIVPDDWQVISKMTNVMGGFSDQRRQVVEYIPNRRLILTGGCVFGGTSLNNSKHD